MLRTPHFVCVNLLVLALNACGGTARNGDESAASGDASSTTNPAGSATSTNGAVTAGAVSGTTNGTGGTSSAACPSLEPAAGSSCDSEGLA